jgi:hypothetical protein
MIEDDKTSNIGAAASLGSLGPCTTKAHHWDSGNSWCNCGELIGARS